MPQNLAFLRNTVRRMGVCDRWGRQYPVMANSSLNPPTVPSAPIEIDQAVRAVPSHPSLNRYCTHMCIWFAYAVPYVSPYGSMYPSPEYELQGRNRPYLGPSWNVMYTTAYTVVHCLHISLISSHMVNSIAWDIYKLLLKIPFEVYSCCYDFEHKWIFLKYNLCRQGGLLAEDRLCK